MLEPEIFAAINAAVRFARVAALVTLDGEIANQDGPAGQPVAVGGVDIINCMSPGALPPPWVDDTKRLLIVPVTVLTVASAGWETARIPSTRTDVTN
jgi:hypothetical protein